MKKWIFLILGVPAIIIFLFLIFDPNSVLRKVISNYLG